MRKAGKNQILHIQNGHNIVTVILPGFNQDGAALLRVLQPCLAGSDILTYRLPRWGFDQHDLVSQMSTALNSYARVIVYAESAGALDAAMLLRANQTLNLAHLVLNAGVSGWQDINAGPVLKLSRLVPGSVVPTGLLRFQQRRAIARSPKLDQGVNEATARAAEQNSANLTGRQVIGEIRRMVTTPPVQPKEFEGRVFALTYMGAPNNRGRLATQDPTIKLVDALMSWEAAVDLFAQQVTPPTWAGLHTPTPEKPQPVMTILQSAIANARH